MRTVKTILFYFLTVCSTLFIKPVHAQKWNWGNLMSVATYDVLPFGMNKDASGNLYLVGNTDEIPVFPNPITPMGGLLSGTHPSQGYLAKINASGTYQWFRLAQGYNTINNKVHVFSNGNIAVIGGGPTVYSGDILFNGVTYHARYGLPTPYFTLYDNNGSELNAMLLEGNSSLIGTSQVGDDLYVFVSAKDTLWYNNTYEAMPTGQQYGLFRLKFNSSGSITELLRIGLDNYQFGAGLSVNVNAQGETYTVLRGTSANPGNGVSVPATGYNKIIATKFDASGNALWATYSNTDVPGPTVNLYAGASTLDAANNLYVVGAFKNKTVVNGQTYTTISANTYNGIMFKINDDGQVLWTNQFDNTVAPSTSYDKMYGVTYNDKGFVYAYGETSGRTNFGSIYYDNKDAWGTPIVAKISYLLKVDTSGVVNQLRIFGNGTQEEFPVAAVVSGDQVFIAGESMNEIDFDNKPTPMYISSPNINTDYKYNTYLARFDDCNAQITKNSTVLTASAGTSYQWNVNGSAITNATSQTYDVGSDVSGKYTVDVTFAGGCVSRSATLPLGEITTGNVIADANQNTLSVYPNPTAGQLNVSLKLPADGHEIKVQVFNSNGLAVVTDEYTNESNHTAYQMNVQELPQGLYYVTLSNGEDTYGSAFIKQ